DHVVLASRFNDFPASLEARSENEAIARPEVEGCASLLRNDRIPFEDVEVLPILVDDPPFARRRFPYAGIEAALRFLEVPGPEPRISRNQPVRRRSALLRFYRRQVEAERGRHGAQIFASDCSMSAMISDWSSIPIDRRTTSGPAPAATCCSSES